MRRMGFEETFVALCFESEVRGNCTPEEFLSCLSFNSVKGGYPVDADTEKRITNICKVLDAQSELSELEPRANDVLQMCAIMLVQEGFMPAEIKEFSYEKAVSVIVKKYNGCFDFSEHFTDAGKEYIAEHRK